MVSLVVFLYIYKQILRIIVPIMLNTMKMKISLFINKYSTIFNVL